MKVYLYDQETGVSLGEDYLPDREIHQVDGVTTVAPPPHGSGEVALFEAASRRWRVVSVLEAHAAARGR